MWAYVPSVLVTAGRDFLLSLGEDILELVGDFVAVAAAIVGGRGRGVMT